MVGSLANFDGIKSYFIEELVIGMSANYERLVTDSDIQLFSEISGDTNPVHLDQTYAATTSFGGRIAHGLLTASLISCVLGTKLPGPGAIYLSQTIQFKAPVRPGDTVSAEVVVRELLPERRRVTLRTQCLVGDKLVVDGEAIVLVNSRNQRER